MSLALTNNTIDKYFGFLVKLDNKSKKKLIAKLKESIEKKEEKDFDLRSLYGAWEDSKTSDEINRQIRESRVEKNDLILVTENIREFERISNIKFENWVNRSV